MAPPEASYPLRLLGATVLRLLGWRLESRPPALGKAVVIAAPHTSNWDVPIMVAAAWASGVRLSWFGKDTLFRAPFGGFFRRIGGIPVDRSAPHNLVQQAVGWFADPAALFLAVAPSGTRRQMPHWRSGFYHIARGAGVPVVCAFLDYGRRVAGVGPVVTLSGDVRADMDAIRAAYVGITGRYPELATPIRLREEDDIIAQAG